MQIATLNINSINARLPNLIGWLRENMPDVMLLQEIKTEFDNFPFFDLQMLGYEAKILGQKGYNGVAILSRYPLKLTAQNLPNFFDKNARYIECETNIYGKNITFASVYLPNGNPPYNNPCNNEKFIYKLNWMNAFLKHARNLIIQNKNVIFAGDFNVIMENNDVYNPELFVDNALFNPQVQAKLRFLTRIGYCDAYRQLHLNESGYTFWDYTGNALKNDLGMRIDYIFTSPYMTDCLSQCKVDKKFRFLEKSSDHTILIADFKDKP